MGIFDILSLNNRNEFIEIGEEFIKAPTRDDIELRDEVELLRRLDNFHTPRERLVEFLKSNLWINDQAATHESVMVRAMSLTGLGLGWLLGGLMRSRDLHDSFIRRHNAAVFDSKHRAKREYVDTYIYNTIRRGAKFGVGACLLCTSAGLIGFGSIAYRNQLYYPDWLVCFGALGAVTRCWLGVRGIVAGAGFGMIGGTLGFGFAKLVEVMSNQSVAKMRYLKHLEYLQERDAQLSRVQRLRQEHDREVLAPWK